MRLLPSGRVVFSTKYGFLLKLVLLLTFTTGSEGECTPRFQKSKEDGEEWAYNGIKYRCDPGGKVVKLGCITHEDKLKAVGKTWQDQEFVRQCKDRAVTILGCIEQSNPLYFHVVGSEYMDGKAKKICKTTGSFVLLCNGKPLPKGASCDVPVVTAAAIKKPTGSASTANVPNVSPKTAYSKEPIAKATAPAITTVPLKPQAPLPKPPPIARAPKPPTDTQGCNDSAGRKREVAETFEEADLEKKCTTKGIEVLGCRTKSNGFVPLHEKTTTKNGKRKLCTENGLKVLGCTFNGWEKEPNDVFSTQGQRLRCEETGLVLPLGCSWEGALYNFSDKIQDKGGKRYMRNCTENGPQKVGCAMSTGEFVPFDGTHSVPTVTRNGNLVYSCSVESGLQLIGCEGANKGELVKFGAKFSNGKLWKICDDEGPRDISYSSSNGVQHRAGEPFTEEGLEKVFDENGNVHVTGCFWNDKRYNPGDSVTDKGLLMTCDKVNGMAVIGCADSKGKKVEFGQKFLDGATWKMCEKHGAQQVTFLTENGRHVPGVPFTEGGLEKVFDEEGKLHTVGCFWNGIRFNPDQQKVDGHMIKKCDKNNGMEVIGCMDSKQIEVTFGKTFFYGTVWRTCGKNGAEELKFPTKSGVLQAPGVPFNENEFEKVFDEQGAVHIVGCMWNSKRYNPGDTDTQNNVDYQCSTDRGMQPVACRDSAGLKVDFGKPFLDGIVWKTCQSSGAKELRFQAKTGLQKPTIPFHEGGMEKVFDETGQLHVTGCYWNDRRINFEDEDKDGSFVLHCSADQGMVVIGCRNNASEIVELEKPYFDGKAWRKCSKQDTDELSFSTKSGVHRAGVSFNDGEGFEKLFDENGKLKVTGCMFNGKRYDIGAIVQDGFLMRKCDKAAGMEVIGCQDVGCCASSVEVGKPFRDSKHVWRSCTKTGADELQFESETGLHRPGVALVEAALQKMFDEHGKLHVTGCFFKGQVYNKTAHTNDGHQILQCSKDFVMEVVACRDSKKVRIEFDQNFFDGNVWRKCGKQEAEELTFTSKSGEPQRPYAPFEEGGFVKVFDENGNARTVGCQFNGARYNISQQVVIDNVVHECTKKTGMTIVGCTDSSGKQISAGSKFNDGKQWQQCTEGGVIELKYASADGVLHTPNEAFQDGEFVMVFDQNGDLHKQGCVFKGQRYKLESEATSGQLSFQCTKDGMKVSGCKRPDGKLVKFGDTFLDGRRWKKCNNDGVVDLSFTMENGERHRPGVPFDDGKLVRVYDENGHVKVVGCQWNDRRFNVSQEVDDGPLVMQCHKDRGMEVTGCRGADGKQVGFGSTFLDGKVWQKCSRNGASDVTFLANDGKRYRPNEQFGDGEFLRAFDENGQLVNKGCFENHQLFNTSQEIVVGNLVYKCTVHGKELKDCRDHKGASTGFEKTFFNGQLWQKCTKSGAEELTFASKTGQRYPPFVPFDDGKFVQMFDENGKLQITGCQWNGHRYNISEEMINANVIRRCTKETGMKGIIGCTDATLNRISVGSTFSDGKAWKKCSANGVEELKYSTKAGALHKPGEPFEEGEFVHVFDEKGTLKKQGCVFKGKRYQFETDAVDGDLMFRCTNDGMIATGCKGPDGSSTKFGETFFDGSNWKKCRKEGVGDLYYRANNGNKYRPGEEFNEGNMVRVFDHNGKLSTVGCFENGRKYGIREEINIGSMAYRCKEDGKKALGCRDYKERATKFGRAFFDGKLWCKCTENGAEELQFTSKSGKLHRPLMPFEEDDLVKMFETSGALQIKGCVSSKGQVNLGQMVDDNGTKKNCTENGLIALEANSPCAFSNSQKAAAIGEVFWVKGRGRSPSIPWKCTAEGPIQWGCKKPITGDYSKVGDEFDGDNLLRFRCDSPGVLKILGCRKAEDSQELLALNEKIIDRGVGKLCNASGLISIGCYSGSKDLVNFGGEFEDGDIKKLCSDRTKSVAILGCKNGPGSRNWGTRFEEKRDRDTFMVECTKKGYVDIGCMYQGKQIGFGEVTGFRNQNFMCTRSGVLPEVQALKLPAEAREAPTVNKKRGLLLKATGYQRTVILIQKQEKLDANVFIRGGVSHSLRKGCQGKRAADSPCSIPIKHLSNTTNESYNVWKTQDNFLDWFGNEPAQGQLDNVVAGGTPLFLTTNHKNSKNYHNLNSFGANYWLVELSMDCSKTADGWFEFKTYTNGEWESDIHQQKCIGDGTHDSFLTSSVSFQSVNHLGRCGYVNVFSFRNPDCQILRFPETSF